MNFGAAEKIANAVLYEGYMLYPYRPSAVKNQQRWNFGTLYPAQFLEVRRGTERSNLHTECLLKAERDAKLGALARFLHTGSADRASKWNEMVERRVECTVAVNELSEPKSFSFSSGTTSVYGSVRMRVEPVLEGVSKLSIDLTNETEVDAKERAQALAHSLVSAHVILQVQGGEFVSLLDPPEPLRQIVARCKNFDCFPVLVGDKHERDMMLCSPIILYDFPQIAPESAGDFFDGTEMDEMLTLRVMTLTDEEKNELRSADERARQLLERTEQTAREQLMRTHGAVRSIRPVKSDE